MNASELFDTVLAMICDREFDPDTTILPWLTHQADTHPDLVAQVVMRLASCCPLDEAERAANQCVVLRERGMTGAVPRMCVGGCGRLIVNREWAHLYPGLLVHNARGLCSRCYASAAKDAQVAA